MEVGIPQVLSSLEKSFISTSRLNIDGMKNSVLDVKLASQSKQLVELDLYNDKDDEGEIMLLAMILLQLHGVKLPTEDDNDLNKKKRQRTSPDQLAILEQIFQTDKMPNQQTRVQLADQLGMSSRRVQIWFQNKRAKVKRSVSKPDGECASPDSLRSSSSSIDSPASPLSDSPSSDASPVLSSSVPAVAPTPQPLQLNALESFTKPASTHVPSTPATPTPASISSTIQTDLSSLKPPQFSSPFVDNKPLLAASY